MTDTREAAEALSESEEFAWRAQAEAWDRSWTTAEVRRVFATLSALRARLAPTAGHEQEARRIYKAANADPASWLDPGNGDVDFTCGPLLALIASALAAAEARGREGAERDAVAGTLHPTARVMTPTEWNDMIEDYDAKIDAAREEGRREGAEEALRQAYEHAEEGPSGFFISDDAPIVTADSVLSALAAGAAKGGG